MSDLGRALRALFPAHLHGSALPVRLQIDEGERSTVVEGKALSAWVTEVEDWETRRFLVLELLPDAETGVYYTEKTRTLGKRVFEREDGPRWKGEL